MILLLLELLTSREVSARTLNLTHEIEDSIELLLATIERLKELELAANEVTTRVQDKYSNSMSYLADLVINSAEGHFVPLPSPPPGLNGFIGGIKSENLHEKKKKMVDVATNTDDQKVLDDVFGSFFNDNNPLFTYNE